jgi:hypothetical protein
MLSVAIKPVMMGVITLSEVMLLLFMLIVKIKLIMLIVLTKPIILSFRYADCHSADCH